MASNTQNINAKAVLNYMFMPGIIPRARELGTSGFGYLAFLFASVYQTVRILPPGHPFTRLENMGRFTIRQVMAEAANNIELKWRNADQIIIFLAMIASVILMVLQFVLVLMALFSGQAFAQAGNPSFTSMFETPNPVNDIAFLMLDYVFGIPASGGGMGPGLGFFGSAAIPAGPTPFHKGLHDLFQFYNLAILVVAAFIFVYYIIIVVVETAQTGVPFGRRFSKIYAPFRLIMAIGLLIPLGYGFNAAQYITLYAAKMGSSFATNGWIVYNNALQENPLGVSNASLVAKPQAPPIDELLYFGSIYHACREMYWIWSAQNYRNPGQEGTCIGAYVLVNGQARQFVVDGAGSCASATGAAGGTYSYAQAKQDFGKSDIEIVLGEYNRDLHKKYAGNVRPYCGKINLPLSNDNPSVWRNNQGAGSNNSQTAEGVRAVEKMYYDTLQAILNSRSELTRRFSAFGERAAHSFVGSKAHYDVCHASNILGDASTCSKPNWDPPASAFQTNYSGVGSSIKTQTESAYTQYRSGLNMQLSAEVRNRGWGGAGIWYNNIADINGTFTSAIYAAPSIKKYPEVMEFVKSKRLEADRSGGSDACSLFSPKLGGERGAIRFRTSNERQIATALNATYQYFACEKPNQESSSATAGETGGGGALSNAAQVRMGGTTRGLTGNVFNDAISMIFGLNGLFDIRTNSKPDESTGQPLVHPLAQLSAIGKSLVENAIRSMGMAIGAAFGGGILSAISPGLGSALGAVSSIFVGVATIGLTAGFILYYILPFLPFIYFFFAVGAWVKSIFEAMVGVPLWALAHLKIDGDGLPGRSAMPGYFLILEIFLRPIVTLFGLIGGIAIFGAMAVAMNLVFDLVIMNVTGSTTAPDGTTLTITDIDSLRRGLIDQFFFTIMYAILLYMMATSSFKMIDTIPSKFMRWIGSSVSTFNDNKGDPTQNLVQYAAVGGSGITSQILGGVRGGASALGGAGGSLIKSMGEGGGQAGK